MKCPVEELDMSDRQTSVGRDALSHTMSEIADVYPIPRLGKSFGAESLASRSGNIVGVHSRLVVRSLGPRWVRPTLSGIILQILVE